MSRPVPRDSMGRIVYVGDVMTCGATVERIMPSGGVGVAFPDDGVSAFPPRYAAVDLDASPPRTNYERYFADIARRGKIGNAIDDICTECASCIQCVFDGFDTGCKPNSCHDFEIWLDEKAVL